MQSNRFIKLFTSVLIVLSLVMLTTTSASAAGPAGNTSQAERLGCQGSTYKHVADYDLRGPAGAKREDIGYVPILVRPSPSRAGDKRVCAFTKHGRTTYGKALYTSIEVGTVSKAGGTQSLRYYDRGTFKKNTNGRAITPGKGRCAVFYAEIRYKGKRHKVWIHTRVCN